MSLVVVEINKIKELHQLAASKMHVVDSLQKKQGHLLELGL